MRTQDCNSNIRFEIQWMAMQNNAPVDGIVESKANTLFIYGVIVLHLLLDFSSHRAMCQLIQTTPSTAPNSHVRLRGDSILDALQALIAHVPSTAYTVY